MSENPILHGCLLIALGVAIVASVAFIQPGLLLSILIGGVGGMIVGAGITTAGGDL